MQEVQGPGKEPTEELKFIREKIVRPPVTKAQIIRRTLTCFLVAVLCGTAAGISFAVAKPIANKYLVPQPETEPFQIPKEELETTAELEERKETVAETEPIGDMLQKAMNEYKFTVDDFNHIYKGLQSVADRTDDGIVTVHSVQQKKDWFDNPVETTGQYAGAVIGKREGEIIILTFTSAIENADQIKVVLHDGTELSGTVKQADHIAGLAIVSIDSTGLNQLQLDQLQEIAIGNTYSTERGDIVIAIGGPAGKVYSSCYGDVAYVMKDVMVADALTHVLYLNMKSDADTGTFLINTKGELIGWITGEFNADAPSKMTRARSISDYKTILEKLTNGVQATYFGIMGNEIKLDGKEKGIPRGVYVSSVIQDSPAYVVGVQNGDIITAIDGKKIMNMREFRKALDGLTAGSVVRITVQRESVDAYKELQYDVTIGVR